MNPNADTGKAVLNYPLHSSAGVTLPSFAPGEKEEFVQRLREHDPEALERFFNLFFDGVYGYVRRRVENEHLAEDLTQDILLKIRRSFASFDASRKFGPWVYTIATNRVRDYWRSQSHRVAQRETSVERDGTLDQLSAGPERPESELEQYELNEQVRAAVDQLPQGMRMIVLLRVYEGLAFETVARILSCTAVAARKRYSRALALLRQSLGSPSASTATL